MKRNSCWRWATGISAALALLLAASATQTALQNRGEIAGLAAAGIVLANAALWALVAAGMWRRRSWSAHLAAGCAGLNLLLGIASVLGSQAGARELAEQGIVVRDTLLTAAIGWAPVLSSAFVLTCLFAIWRSRE